MASYVGGERQKSTVVYLVMFGCLPNSVLIALNVYLTHQWRINECRVSHGITIILSTAVMSGSGRVSQTLAELESVP